MGTLFFSDLFGVHTGAEELFIQDVSSAPTTVTPGKPSFMTMFSFIWIAITAVLASFNPKGLTPFLKITGLIIGGIGIVAVFGYLLNVPLLYYYVAGVSSAMAFHTAVLFVFLGAGFLCL
jgi:nitric oxide reductase large subunit